MATVAEVISGKEPWAIDVGDCLPGMESLPDCCVQTAVTSPPYFDQRSNGSTNEVGSEATPAEYVDRLVVIFRELRRVLRKDGTFWLNIGDKFDAQKSMLGIPGLVSAALRKDNWLQRAECIWCKKTPQPNSATDRPVYAHEMVYLFSRSSKYFYEMDAERVKVAPSTVERDKYTRVTTGKDGQYAVQHDHETPSNPKGRNLWSYWTDISPASFGWQLCDACGRIYDGKEYRRLPHGPGRSRFCECGVASWCTHFSHFPPGLARRCIRLGSPEQSLVLDPFSGVGTTALVCRQLNRRSIGFELNEKYVTLANARISGFVEKKPRAQKKVVVQADLLDFIGGTR